MPRAISSRAGRARVVRGSAVVGSIVLTTLAASAAPALAAASEEGIDSGKSLGLGLWFLIYAGIPFAVFAVIALLVYGPALARRPRYRPGYQDWGYRPVWIGGPDNPDTALTSASPDTVLDIRGGGAGARW